jgi:hypothetical protein
MIGLSIGAISFGFASVARCKLTGLSVDPYRASISGITGVEPGVTVNGYYFQ